MLFLYDLFGLSSYFYFILKCLPTKLITRIHALGIEEVVSVQFYFANVREFAAHWLLPESSFVLKSSYCNKFLKWSAVKEWLTNNQYIKLRNGMRPGVMVPWLCVRLSYAENVYNWCGKKPTIVEKLVRFKFLKWGWTTSLEKQRSSSGFYLHSNTRVGVKVQVKKQCTETINKNKQTLSVEFSIYIQVRRIRVPTTTN